MPEPERAASAQPADGQRRPPAVRAGRRAAARRARPLARGGAVSALVERIERDVGRALARGRNGLRYAAGTSRPKVGQTPKDVVWRRHKAQLWRYRSDDVRYRPPVLVVHSLVSRSYVLDLYPGNSAVDFFRRSGLDVYLIDWGVADEAEAGNTLETYADDYIPAAIEATGAEEVT